MTELEPRLQVPSAEARDLSPSPTDPEQAPARGAKWKPLVLLTAVVGVMLLAKFFGVADRLGQLRHWIDDLGPLGPLVFLLIYALATVLALPGSVLTVIAGAIFGSWVGVITVIFAATLGASLSFLISRHIARDAVSGWLNKKEKFRRLDELTARHGAIMVAITRLLPIFPFNLLNYGFGLTRVPFCTYVLWSFICMLPATVLYVVGTDAVLKSLAGDGVPWPLLGIVSLALVGLIFLVRLAKNRLAQKEASPQSPVAVK